jgi:hypothetical protein
LTLPQGSSDLFADDDFSLNMESLVFLDQVFATNFIQTEPNVVLSTSGSGDFHPVTNDGHFETQEQLCKNGIFPADKRRHSSWLDGFEAPGDITAALEKYFTHTATYLPILLEDAFWDDYHKDRCSRTLLYAIACRGVPFMERSNKWCLQQQLAHRFREAFLEDRSNIDSGSAIRLDDLEALALMIDFNYDDATSQPLHSNLGQLFLSHQALVLMILQLPTEIDSSQDTYPSTVHARESERRVLLYWHVYGLDAFHCLDRKQMSLIPDPKAVSDRSVSQLEAKDYFDAILGLAIIARKIVRLLCSPEAKRRGVQPNDVLELYGELSEWKNSSWPSHLRRERDSVKEVNIDQTQIGTTTSLIHLRSAVLSALEVNCLMQIECCVSDYGMCDDDNSLSAEMTALKVEFESLRAVTDMITLCQWMEPRKYLHGKNEQHSLVDLAPNVIRNACAGTCFWLCHRRTKLCLRHLPTAHLPRNNHGEQEGRPHINPYATAAKQLRDAASTATSHSDTMQIVEYLDTQRALPPTSPDTNRSA